VLSEKCCIQKNKENSRKDCRGKNEKVGFDVDTVVESEVLRVLEGVVIYKGMNFTFDVFYWDMI